MMRQAVGIVLVCGVVAGCAQVSESRFNPLNWFGRSQPEAATLGAVAVRPVDDRPLIDVITSLSVDRTPGGAVVRATGLAPVQGWYDAELVPETLDGLAVDGTLSFTFRALPPPAPTRVSTPASRELVVGTYLSDAALAGVRAIRVVGRTNARVARR